jgi:hypothetical protein
MSFRDVTFFNFHNFYLKHIFMERIFFSYGGEVDYGMMHGLWFYVRLINSLWFGNERF